MPWGWRRVSTRGARTRGPDGGGGGRGYPQGAPLRGDRGAAGGRGHPQGVPLRGNGEVVWEGVFRVECPEPRVVADVFADFQQGFVAAYYVLVVVALP